MALCGYNKKMLDGLRRFAEGLGEQLEKRSQQEQKTIIETLRLEIDEMVGFEKDLRSIPHPEEAEDVLGVVYLARFLYRKCLEAGGSKENYTRISEASVDRQFHMDEHYYGNLRPTLGPVSGLSELAKWLTERPL